MSSFAKALLTLNACAAALLVSAALAGPDEEDDRPVPAAPGEYVGVDGCKKCHFASYKTWKKNEHPKAFEVLPAKYKADPSCLKCHTTGYGQSGGFKSEAETPKLAGVQCEMCHGPSEKHAAFMKENEKKKDDPAIIAKGIELLGGGGVQAARKACYKCHLAQTHDKHPDYDK